MESKVYECHSCFNTPCRLEIFEEFVAPDRCPYDTDNEPQWMESLYPLPRPKRSMQVVLPGGYFKT